MVKVGSSGVDVSQVGRGVRGGPPAVLLQDVSVGFGVKVCPPHQHLTISSPRGKQVSCPGESYCYYSALVSMEGVDEASLQQVQDLNGAVTGAADQVVVGWVEGKAVDSCTVDLIMLNQLVGP